MSLQRKVNHLYTQYMHIEPDWIWICHWEKHHSKLIDECNGNYKIPKKDQMCCSFKSSKYGIVNINGIFECLSLQKQTVWFASSLE